MASTSRLPTNWTEPRLVTSASESCQSAVAMRAEARDFISLRALLRRAAHLAFGQRGRQQGMGFLGCSFAPRPGDGFNFRLGNGIAKDLAKGTFEDFVAPVADSGDSRLHLEVGDNADALRRALVGVEHAESADHRAETAGQPHVGDIAVGP